MGNRSDFVLNADWNVHFQHRGENDVLNGAKNALLEDSSWGLDMAK